MRITWQVDDGYVGGRPQHTEIDDEELEECETEDEKRALIEDIIQEEFYQKISFYITHIDDKKV